MTFDSLLKQQYYCIHNANRLFLVKFISTVVDVVIQFEDFTIQLKAGTVYLGGGTTDLKGIENWFRNGMKPISKEFYEAIRTSYFQTAEIAKTFVDNTN